MSAGTARAAVDSELPAGAFPGEDTRPTSRKELYGFYAYSFAAEVFVVCGLGAFIPITLEELARGSATAVLASDHTKPCRPNNPSTHSLAIRDGVQHGEQCVFKVLGAEVNTASFAMYTFSVSVFIQALLVVTMSGAADHGQYRKTLLLTFAFTGAIATMLFLPVTSEVYLFGSLWAIIGNVSFGGSAVLLNSFLPLLVRRHPEVLSFKQQEAAPSEVVPLNGEEDDDNTGEFVDPTAALLSSGGPVAPAPVTLQTSSIELQLSTKISSYGVAIGYGAAVAVQAISVILLVTAGASLFTLKLVLFLVGLWWFIFTIPAGLWLRPRPGPPLMFGKTGQQQTWLGYLTYSWKNLARTVIRARRLRDVLLFLAAWFMISDGIATVSGTAILFAKTTLNMPSSALAMINVIVIIFGIIGAVTWSTVSRRYQLRPSQTILVCICLFELIPLYGLLGYIPFIRSWGVIGLQQQWEMYPLGAVYGLVLGGLSSYCRSLFGELIPPGSEAAFYALYAITDKGSSIFGPAIVGAITDATGDIRPAFIFLTFLIGLPIPLMSMVDVERGKREGAALAKEMNAVVRSEESRELYTT
ncbi:hypothetical protein AMS68_005908 [Peltaster fructicola]|uniref:Autophagy-related protein n=1 Tax=Peltaster fructicola TaxID=286661 RepID=A0A6H0Y0E7_9PEZI|nr:hypothetical protein AMS68_005908 [Peltaster fructicola]